LATLAQAIRRTKATVPRRIQRASFTSPTATSFRGRTQGRMPICWSMASVSSPGNASGRFGRMRARSLSAPSGVAPGRSRATEKKLKLTRARSSGSMSKGTQSSVSAKG